jgi:Protein of unknown function (DUF3606)
MADDRERGSPDNQRIDVTDPDEVHNWSASLNVTPQQLTDAGTSASKVREHLQGK